jgi:hypothetical protein
LQDHYLVFELEVHGGFLLSKFEQLDLELIKRALVRRNEVSIPALGNRIDRIIIERISG